MVKLKKKFFLLKKRKIYERLDIVPFLIIYSLLVIIIYFTYLRYILLFNYIFFGIFFIVQGAINLLKHFFENIIYLFYSHVDNIENATDVKVNFFSEHYNINNKTVICKIIRENNIIKIEVEKKIYIYDTNINEFYPSKYELLKNYKVSQLLKIKPLTKDILPEKKTKFGDNLIKIPIPSFYSLYKEHIFSSFFIFQLFCILLRSFDNFIYNSLISLIMILFFEIAIAYQRIFNLATLRNMRVPPHYIYVYRDNEWKEIPSNELYPGDIVSVIEGSLIKNIKVEDKDTKNNFIFKIIKRIKEIKKREEEAKNQKSINTVLNKYKEKDILPVTCDMLLLYGSAIVNESMLTGESIPQIKNSIRKIENLRDLILDTKNKHKNSIIFAGTKVVTIQRNEESEPLPKNIKNPPNNGIIGLVIKTGFNTKQGKFLHKILYNKEKIQDSNKKEDIIIILFLLFIAIIASCYFLYEGIKREETFNYKLIFRCIIIITSIVPADLPIELSLINNKSLSFFESKRIVCVEPYRIPLAGKIDICCFDKTGTLTNEFIFKGIVDIDSYKPESALEINEETFSVLLGCNSIIDNDGKPIGDPIDIAMFKEIGGKIENNEIICKKKTKIVPIRKYNFESDLKKMTVLAKVYSEKHKKNPYIRVLCKGAPETIKNLLKEMPENYDDCYLKWAKKGYIILALAYKDNERFDYNTKRVELEKNLIFCGFALLETPIKQNVDKYIKELKKAKYNICLITGDHLLTTLKVSKDLELGPEKYASLKIENKKIKWNDLDNNLIKETKSIEEIKLLSSEYTLGLTGDEYQKLNLVTNIPNIYNIIQYITLFCRISQIQKVEIIKDLIKSGKNPSMCGDGSNDVGALKLSSIGVVLLNIRETKIQKKEPFNFSSFEDETTIKNWDATTVAAFTSKGESIKCIKNIFVQGRCALAIKIQMYKIFILNGLLTIYIESYLALKGIKFSEYQTLYLNFGVSMFFLMLSKAKPLNKLNPNKPPITIFNLPAIISILGQFFIHISSIILVIYLTENVDPFLIGQEKSWDEKFSPNLINTIILLFQIFNQTIIFVINYIGEPFMENILKNSSMMKLILGISAIGSIIFFNLYPQLNEDFELVSLPEDNNYKITLIIIMIFNFILCYIFEKWRSLFGLYESYEKSKSKKKKN